MRSESGARRSSSRGIGSPTRHPIPLWCHFYGPRFDITYPRGKSLVESCRPFGLEDYLIPRAPEISNLRGHGIEEDVMSRNLFIAHDDHIEAGVVGRLIMRARAPSQATGIVKSLRLAVRRVN